MPKVRKRDDAGSANPQNLSDRLIWPLQRLQRLSHHDIVERLGLELTQAIIDIGMNNVYPGFNTACHVVRVNFEAVPAYATGLCQMGEQSAIAATEVKNARPRRDPETRAGRSPPECACSTTESIWHRSCFLNG